MSIWVMILGPERASQSIKETSGFDQEEANWLIYFQSSKNVNQLEGIKEGDGRDKTEAIGTGKETLVKV